MSEQRFDPVKEFVNLRDNLSKTVGDGLKNIAGGNIAYPAVDIYETDTEVIVVTAPILGAISNAFEVSMERDILSIVGHTKDEREIPEEFFLQRELHFGTFRRDVRITRSVNPQEAKASFKGGRLTIKLPRLNQPEAQIIDVIPTQ